MRGVISPPAKPLIKAREAVLDVGVQYLAGGGAGNLPVKMRTEIRPKYLSSFESYDDFIFANGSAVCGVKRRGEYSSDDSDEGDSAKTVKLPIQNLVLDAAGSLRVVIDRLPQVDLPRRTCGRAGICRAQWRNFHGLFACSPVAFAISDRHQTGFLGVLTKRNLNFRLRFSIFPARP